MGTAGAVSQREVIFGGEGALRTRWWTGRKCGRSLRTGNGPGQVGAALLLGGALRACLKVSFSSSLRLRRDTQDPGPRAQSPAWALYPALGSRDHSFFQDRVGVRVEGTEEERLGQGRQGQGPRCWLPPEACSGPPPRWGCRNARARSVVPTRSQAWASSLSPGPKSWSWIPPSPTPRHPICRGREAQAFLARAGPSQQTSSPAYGTSGRPRRPRERRPVPRNRRCLSVSNRGPDEHPQVRPRPLGEGAEGTEQGRGGAEAALGLGDPQFGGGP